MKNLMVVLAFLLSITAFGQSVSIGGAGIYGDDIKTAGIQLRAYYNFKGDRVCFGPEFSNFFTATETHNGQSIDKKLKEFNFNFHYVFELNEKWGFYPLVGLNYSSEVEETMIGNELEVHKEQEFGTNLGIGVHRPKNNWVFFGEYDHLFSELSQSSFILGVFYTIGKKHNEHTNE